MVALGILVVDYKTRNQTLMLTLASTEWSMVSIDDLRVRADVRRSLT